MVEESSPPHSGQGQRGGKGQGQGAILQGLLPGTYFFPRAPPPTFYLAPPVIHPYDEAI